MRQSERLKQYKFKIQYISEKNNSRADALSRRNNYIKTKKLFNYNILKINKNRLLSANKYKLNTILQIFRDNTEKFLIKKEKLQISIDKIDKYIKKYYNKLLQEYSRVIKIFQFLYQYCQFLQIRQAVEIYIKQYFNYQQNKHSIHANYNKIQYQKLFESLQNKITINFIIKLSKSTNSATENRYNSILIIVNKLIKYLYIIVCKEKFNAEQLKYIILDRLIQYYNIFKKLISNRDKLFISNY